MEAVNGDNYPIPKNQTSTPTNAPISSKSARWIFKAALILFVIIIIPVLLSLFRPHTQQTPKTYTIPKQTTNTSTSPIRFSYDISKAQKTLEGYVRDNIKEEFLPSKINVEENLISSGKTNGTDYEFGANWKSNNISYNATLHYIKNSNALRDTEFYINPPFQNIAIDMANSAMLVKTYLKNLPESVNFDCGTYKESTKFCEHVIIEDTGKSGFGIVNGIGDSGKNITLIFSCFIPKNDSYYNKRTSCLLFREKKTDGL